MITGRLEPPGEDGAERAANSRAARDDRVERDFLQIARDMYNHSTDYVTANLRGQWDRNIRMFQSRHAANSKYLSGDYAHRSKLFRPKSRSAVRRSEATVASAFFATTDVLNVTAADDNDPRQQASAAVAKALLQHRLTKTIAWFQTLLGAWQDTRVMGFCCSKQWWEYAEKTVGYELVQQKDPFTGAALVDETGAYVVERVPVKKIVKDRPAVRLFPPENIRIDPAADWIEPIASSPYLIALHPMFVTDVKARMTAVDAKSGQPQWRKAEDDVIAKARPDVSDSTRQARQNTRQDPNQQAHELRDFDIVMVHENFARLDGEDYVWYTLGTEHVLSDAAPIREVYFHGQRPYVMGVSTLETHKAVPSSAIELTQDLQQAANEIVNQRIDNVRFVMNGRYFVRRGKDVDLASIKNNVPGSATLMSDPEKDVVLHRPPDVTSSAYMEQDRINVDFDELAGHFSVGTVASDRQLNETVGGMNLLSNAVNGVQEFDIRVFAETWVEPVLRQLVLLEQAYETDVTVLALAGKKAELFERFGFDQVGDELLTQELTISVNVGFGASDPMQRIQRFQIAAQTVGMALGQSVQQMLNPEEIVSEVFGAVGYKDGARFFNMGDDPKTAMLRQQVQQLQSALQDKTGPAQVQAEAKLKQAMAELEVERARMLEELKLEREKMMGELQTKLQIAVVEALLEQRMDTARITQESAIERERIQSEERRAEKPAVNLQFEARDQVAEMSQAIREVVASMRQTIADAQAVQGGMADQMREAAQIMSAEREIYVDPASGKKRSRALLPAPAAR